jgi:dCTP deaminase
VILTDREIQIALNEGQIIVDPAPTNLLVYTSTSLDLTLESHISEFHQDIGHSALEQVIDPSHETFSAEKILEKITKQITIDKDGYKLIPNKLVLGWTVERIHLPIPSRIAARVEGRSSLARFGLGVHITAPTIHAGFNNPIRLEIFNHGELPIRLRTGMRICQLIFESTMGTPQKAYQQVQSAPLFPPSSKI